MLQLLQASGKARFSANMPHTALSSQPHTNDTNTDPPPEQLNNNTSLDTSAHPGPHNSQVMGDDNMATHTLLLPA